MAGSRKPLEQEVLNLLLQWNPFVKGYLIQNLAALVDQSRTAGLVCCFPSSPLPLARCPQSLESSLGPVGKPLV